MREKGRRKREKGTPAGAMLHYVLLKEQHSAQVGLLERALQCDVEKGDVTASSGFSPPLALEQPDETPCIISLLYEEVKTNRQLMLDFIVLGIWFL